MCWNPEVQNGILWASRDIEGCLTHRGHCLFGLEGPGARNHNPPPASAKHKCFSWTFGKRNFSLPSHWCEQETLPT